MVKNNAGPLLDAATDLTNLIGAGIGAKIGKGLAERRIIKGIEQNIKRKALDFKFNPNDFNPNDFKPKTTRYSETRTGDNFI